MAAAVFHGLSGSLLVIELRWSFELADTRVSWIKLVKEYGIYKSVITSWLRYDLISSFARWAILDCPRVLARSSSRMSRGCRAARCSGRVGNIGCGLEKLTLGAGMMSKLSTCCP